MEQKFKMSFWLHSHNQTGEFLQFDLFELEGKINSNMIEHITDTEIMKDEIINADLDNKGMLEKVLKSDCIFHFASEQLQEDNWIEFLDTKEVEVKDE
jgi:hypothetical protein